MQHIISKEFYMMDLANAQALNILGLQPHDMALNQMRQIFRFFNRSHSFYIPPIDSSFLKWSIISLQDF